MTAAVLSAYRFHMFELARQLKHREQLDCLYTAMPKSQVTEVPEDRLRTHPVGALLRHAWERVAGPSSTLNWWVVRDFDDWCSRTMSGHDLTIHASSFSTRAMRISHQRGSKVICDRGAQHIIAQKRLLETECRRLGLVAPQFDDRLIDRELEEYEIADVIVVPSQAAVSSYIAEGIDPRKLIRIPYGVDTSSFVPLEESTRNLRKVLSVGTLGPQKGQHILVEAFRRLTSDGATLELLGGRDDRRFIERFIRPDSRVLLKDTIPRSAMPRAMGTAGIFALMSVHDGFGMVVAQAMSCGLPVIVSDAVGAADIVADGEDGFVVPYGDIDTLTDRLGLLLEDTSLVLRMGERARSKSMSLGGWQEYGASYDLLCRGLVGR